MPKGHASKREKKKPKKNLRKTESLGPPAEFVSAEVEVIKKKRKNKDD